MVFFKVLKAIMPIKDFKVVNVVFTLLSMLQHFLCRSYWSKKP